MKYIVDIPVLQTNEEADAAWASVTINNGTFVSKSQLTDKLKTLNIDKFFLFQMSEIVSYVNNGNDFSDSYLAEVEI